MAAGADDRVFGQIQQACAGTADDRIGDIGPLGDRADDDARHRLGWQVLEAMHRQVDLSQAQRLLDLERKDAFAADLGQGRVERQVAFGGDDDDGKVTFGIGDGQTVSDGLGLLQRQPGAARAYPNLVPDAHRILDPRHGDCGRG